MALLIPAYSLFYTMLWDTTNCRFDHSWQSLLSRFETFECKSSVSNEICGTGGGVLGLAL